MIDSVFQHFEALEADFQRYYHLDLRDCLWGEEPMGARKFMSLVKWLPTDAAFFRSQDPNWYWDQETELLATTAELVDSLRVMFYQANTDPKKAKRMKPIDIQRPWSKTRDLKPISFMEAMSLLGGRVNASSEWKFEKSVS